MRKGGWINSRDDWIRTSGLFVPNEARYRAALHPVYNTKIIFDKEEVKQHRRETVAQGKI